MRWKGLVVLLLLLGGLVFAWRARERDRVRREAVVAAVQYSIFEGFAPERVVSIRIDHARRGQVKLERDAQGTWYLTDPIAYPANPGIVTLLLKTMSGARGEPAGDVDLADVQLSPPNAVIEFTQRDEAGDRVYRLEVGGNDLDGERVFVRVANHSQSPDGQPLVLLCTRTIANTLERNPDDYRDARITPLTASEVTGFERSGSPYVPERKAVVDLDIIAERGVDGWRKKDSPTVRLESSAVSLLAGAAAELKARRFASDAPDSYAAWGLDPPQFSITLHSPRGDPVRLDFGYPAGQGPSLEWPELWYCRRAGSPYVFELDGTDVDEFVVPSEYLYDYFLVHARRDDMARVELEALGRTLVLDRSDDRWTVSVEGPDGALEPFPASTGAVEDVLATIEKTELNYPVTAPGAGPLAFAGTEPPMSIVVLTKDGTRWGGRIGAEWRDPRTSLTGRMFVRFGDELTGVIEENVSDLCTLDVDHFRSLQVHQIREAGVREIRLRRGDETFAYVHPDDQRWLVTGTQFDAPRHFRECLQFLLSIRADRWLDGIAPAALTDSVEVTVALKSGDDVDFRVGRLADGTLVCLEGGLAAAISKEQQDQHALAWGGEFFPTLLLLFGGADGE